MSSPRERLQRAADKLSEEAEGIVEAAYEPIGGPDSAEKGKLLTQYGLQKIKEAVKEIEEIIR